MKIGFQDPEYGIPCIAEWDEGAQILMLDIENGYDAEEYHSPEDIKAVRNWCMRNTINCDSEVRMNAHLDYLGIRE